MRPERRIGVVIPAHNEESMIGRCLNALLSDAEPGEFDVVVVANGCNDKTAEIARGFGSSVNVVETLVGCKTSAMNIGDSSLDPQRYPRIYLDSDLILTTKSAREMCEAVSDSRVLAASPQFEFDTSSSSALVRAYYAAWQQMPYLNDGRIAGAYVLSEKGRTRFKCFPKVISDDGFVRLQFSVNERSTLKTCSVLVSAPQTFADLIKIKTRSRLGTKELKRKFPELFENETASGRNSFHTMLRKPRYLPQYFVYVLLNMITRTRAQWQEWTGYVGWERDDSSRI